MTDPIRLQLAPLFKHTRSEAAQVWQISVEPNDDGSATIVTTYGLVGGKSQTKRDVVKTGKNVGKKNETTAFQQACAEAEATWNKQRDRKHYGLTTEESRLKRLAAPMLAEKIGDFKDKVDWTTAYEQPKLDGYRCIATRLGDTVTLVSREGQPFQLPHISRVLLERLEDGQRLDGELYIPATSLPQISSLIKRPRQESEALLYHVYDSPIEELSFAERNAVVRRIIGRTGSCGPLQLVPTVVCTSYDQLLELQEQRIADGFEGSMLRYGNDGYECGARSQKLLKVKTFHDDQFLITGVKEGRGDCVGMPIWQLQTKDGHTFDCLSHGSHAEKRQHWNDRERHIGRKLVVKYAYYTDTATPVPWHPVAKCFHEE